MQHRHYRITSTATAITVLVAALAFFGVVMTGAVSAGEPAPVMGGAAPHDIDCDGEYEDVNGDGSANIVDVQAMFVNRNDIAERADATMFDVSGDGSVNIVDVQVMFTGLGSSDTRLDLCEVERKIHEYINEERTSRGLDPINRDTELSNVARFHSRDMAENDYLSHTSLGGEDFGDRYAKFGYECRVLSGVGSYLLGSENIAQTYYNTRVNTGEEIVTYDTEAELARGIVDGWMNSPGHRDNILTEQWNNEGIGIATTMDDGNIKVYATQNFC